MINMDIVKTEDEIAAEEIIKILKTFFETDKHILLTAPPGHGKTWAINKIYDIFEFQKLFDRHKVKVLKLKEELNQGTFEETFKLLKQKCDKQDKKNPINDDIKSIVDSYLGILQSVSGNHSSLSDYIVDYLERYMSSNEISNQFNNDVIKIAPTGVAASNIDGMTYHSFFALKVFSNSDRRKISNADSRIIRYLQNINGYGIAELLYQIPDGQEKIITNNDNLFRVINQEIIIFDEISMIYDLSLDLLWKLTHDLQDVIREIHKHFRYVRKYNIIDHDEIYYQIENNIPDIISWEQKRHCEKSGKIIIEEVKKDVSEIKSTFINMMTRMNAIDLMFRIAKFFSEMIPGQLDIDFEIFHNSLLHNDIYVKMAEDMTKEIIKIVKRYHGVSKEEKNRCYLENLCLKTVYEVFRVYFKTNGSEIPYNIQLFYGVMRSCNNNYKFISNMGEIDSIKPIKFLFVGDFLQIQPFETIDTTSPLEANEIVNHYLKPRSIADNTVSLCLYKDINSFFSNIFAESSNKIEKLALTICKRQSKEEIDFRNLILDMRLGMPLTDTSRKLLRRKGRIIKCTVDKLLESRRIKEDKNDITILSMCNHYSELINKSLILKDYTGDIDIIPNTLLRKVISYEGPKNKYLDTSVSEKNINSRIRQLCYLSYFMKESSRGRFNIVLDNEQMTFLESFVDDLKLSIVQFFGDDETGAHIYDKYLDDLSKIIIRQSYDKIVKEVINKNGKSSKITIKKYKYKISKTHLDKIRICASLREKHTIETLIDNLIDVRNDIEDEIDKILSNHKYEKTFDLIDACKEFLEDIENSNDIITEFINDIKDMGENIASPDFNYNELHKRFRNITAKYKNVNHYFKELCEKFLDDINKYMTDETNIKTTYTNFLNRIKLLEFWKRTITLHKPVLTLVYDNKSIYHEEICPVIILPISEDQVIKINEIPIKKAIHRRGKTNESSNISVFVKDMKCMITKNKRSYKSDTGFLYVNGSMGNFEEIKYGKLYIKLKDRDSRVDVAPEIEPQSGDFLCLRFPVVPAYSISTNKSQGLTIPDKVILNLNQKNGGMWWYSDRNKDWFFNLVVAISRCTKLENLIINRYIDRNPNDINDLKLPRFINYMFHNMYDKADPKSRLIFDIERDKDRCQSVLKEMYNLRKRRKFNE